MASEQALIREGTGRASYKVEFRTWNGSAYEWTDYTRYFHTFANIGVQVEERAYPQSFRIHFSSITFDNTSGFFDDPTTLDGKLINASEPYGSQLYKRKVRVSQVWYNQGGGQTVTVLAVAAVRDLTYTDDGLKVVMPLMSLSALASDQKVDGEKANRHPLGSSVASSPSDWTASAPAATGTVAMYRSREKEDDQDTYQYQWFTYKRHQDIMKHTAWALDDIATDIQDKVIYTTDGREIVTNRGTPPDDPAVSTGSGDNRTRAIVWNTERAVLVVCIGNKVYDYEPITNVYTLQNTLTVASSSTQIVRAFYIEDADSAGKVERIILFHYDVSAYTARTTTAYITVLDATGSGAYSVLDNATSLGSNVFPGTHQVREGPAAAPVAFNEKWVGQWVNDPGPVVENFGENCFSPFAQSVREVNLAYAQHQDDSPLKTGIFSADTTDYTIRQLPWSFGRGYFAGRGSIDTGDYIGIMWSWGQQAVCALSIFWDGGTFLFCTYDTTPNFYRLRQYDLYNYTLAAYITQPTATWVPQFMYCTGPGESNNVWVMMSSMEWDDSAGNNYSTSHIWDHSLNTSAQNDYDWLSGAPGTNVAWTAMEICYVNGEWPILAFNRATLKWTIFESIETSWGANTFKNTTNNRLIGFHVNTNYSTDRAYFIETQYAPGATSSGLLLRYYDGTDVVAANTTPDGVEWPVNTDLGSFCYMTHTPVNYPDANTPDGITFGVSANDYGDAGTSAEAGDYSLFQHANYLSGFVKLLDFSGMSFFDLRNAIAESIGFVHYYDFDGTFVFRPRITTVGTPDFAFSAANRNYDKARLVSSGWERVLNEIEVRPYEITREDRISDIVKGDTGSESTGQLTDVQVAGSPGETAKWQAVFVSTTTYSLFKLVGSGSDPTSTKAASISIDDILRGTDITDGAYLSIFPEYWQGIFATGDNFTWYVLEPQESLEQLDARDRVLLIEPDSRDEWERAHAQFDNRFINKLIASDYAGTILDYRKDPHAVVEIIAPFDAEYKPLKTFTIVDSGLPFTVSDKFWIATLQIAAKDKMVKITGVKI